MTTIIGFTDGETVWMAADRLAVSRWEQKFELATPKIVRRYVSTPTGKDGHNGYALLGVSGPSAFVDLLKRMDLPNCGEDVDAWASAVARKFTRAATDRGKYLTDDEGRPSGTVLLGFAGHLWEIAAGAACRTPWPYLAVGSGDDVALGAMHVQTSGGDPLLTPERIARMLGTAMAAARCHDNGTGGAVWDLFVTGADAAEPVEVPA